MYVSSYSRAARFGAPCEIIAHTNKPLLHVVDNATSVTFHDYGANTYNFSFAGPNIGDYFSDTFLLGDDKIKITNQTMASANSSTFPVSILGVGPQGRQVGVFYDTFREYPPFLQNLVTQGYYESSAMSVWLDPDLGPPNGPTSIPSGKVMFGGVDTSLFIGLLTTLPLVSTNATKIPDTPETWSLALSALRFTHGNGESFVRSPAGESCVISTGAAYLVLSNDTFTALISSFDQAVFNKTTGWYQMPCSQRLNSSNSLSFTFSDPRYMDATDNVPGKSMKSFTLQIPPSDLIWPSKRLDSEADQDTCSLAVQSGSLCDLGVILMKHGYFVYDLGNREISVAKSVKQGTKRGHVVKIPAGGVRDLNL
jgi:hypothetical protein